MIRVLLGFLIAAMCGSGSVRAEIIAGNYDGPMRFWAALTGGNCTYHCQWIAAVGQIRGLSQSQPQLLGSNAGCPS